MVNVRRRGFFFQEPALFGWSPALAHEHPFAHSAYNTSRKVRQWDIHLSPIQSPIEDLQGGPEEILLFLWGDGKEPFPFFCAIHWPLKRVRSHLLPCSRRWLWRHWCHVFGDAGAVLLPPCLKLTCGHRRCSNRVGLRER